MSLTTNYTFTGNANWSIDGTGGSRSDGGTMQVDVPTGSTIEAAFLYATAFSSTASPAVNLRSGDAVRALEQTQFTALCVNTDFSSLQAHRTDVTTFVDQIVNSGSDDPFEFSVDGMGGSIDGYSLVVVYSNPAEEQRTIAFLDGFSASGGDDFRLAFGEPLEVNDDFEALMSLGIGFGFQRGSGASDQYSLIDVNGERLTSAAGGYDDGSSGNGGLNTVGGIGDSTDNPADPGAFPDGTQTDDDELYDLAIGDFLETGDTSILVQTENPSNDDNIYFAGFRLDGEARIATAGNDAPVAVNDAASTSKTAPIRIADVTGNDFDPDGDPITLINVNGAPINVGDTLTLATGALLTYVGDGAFDYDPNGTDADSDSFRYTISDGAATGSARVDIDLTDTEVPARLSLTDGVVLEGDSGTTALEFTVVRTGNTANELTVEIEVTGISADAADVAGGLPTIVTATLAAGATSATVSVPVNGDTTPEFDETLRAEITGVSTTDTTDFGNEIVDGVATLTILDDDRELPPPPPPVEADIWGDPHLTSLDGLGYDFQAVGEFILLEATSGDDITVQVRTTPINDAVSVISVMATEIDGNTIQIDEGADTPLTINGTAFTIDPLDGPIDVGGGQVYYDAAANMYTIVYPSGEQVAVGVYDGFMNVCAFLNDTRPAGSVQGLLGNADGDRSNDLALRDGTVLPQPVDYDDLYGQYADSWRIAESEALFDRATGETTADFTDTSYPRVFVTLDDLPAQLVADATAIVDAAGITDPILRQNAILDVALTGNTDFADSATALAADPEESTDPANAPALGAAIGINAAAMSITEGDSGDKAIQFEVYRVGDTSGAISATVTISGDTDEADFSQLFDPADLMLEFAADELSKTIVARIAGDTDVEMDETVTATLSVDPASGISVVAQSASVEILDDDEGEDPLPQDQTGTAANDTLTGDDRANTLVGLGGNDTLDGGAGGDSLDGGDGDDLLRGGTGPDTMTGGAGADDFIGVPTEFAGDVITDFGMDDRIVVEDMIFTRGDFSVQQDTSTTIGADFNDDDTVGPDEAMTLNGTYTGGEFMTGSDGTDTFITFEEHLAEVSERTALDTDDINGIVNQGFLTGNGTNDFRITLDDRTAAGYDNVLGVYEIDGNGNIVDVRILVDNANGATTTADITDVEGGNQLGFFIVQDGADWLDGLAEGDSFSFVDAGGEAANIDDGAEVALAVNGVAVNQRVFHSFDAALNGDGAIHAISGANEEDDGASLFVGFEDKTGGGDRDYQDVLFSVEMLAPDIL